MKRSEIEHVLRASKEIAGEDEFITPKQDDVAWFVPLI
jgi:hypothetical protein